MFSGKSTSDFDNAILGFPVRVVRSSRRRKTIRMEVTDCEVLVRTPPRTTPKEIQATLNAHRQWLHDTVTKQQKRQEEVSQAGPRWKQSLLYQGIPLRLAMVQQNAWSVSLNGTTLQIAGPLWQTGKSPQWSPMAGAKPSRGSVRAIGADDLAYEAVLHWYRNQARGIIGPRVEFWSRRLQLAYHQMRIKDQRTRWGSCSSQRNLNFNWRLVLVPPKVLDYVIVHELCHLWEMNHSREFWAKVSGILPDYQNHRQWLKKHGEVLLDIFPRERRSRPE